MCFRPFEPGFEQNWGSPGWDPAARPPYHPRDDSWGMLNYFRMYSCLTKLRPFGKKSFELMFFFRRFLFILSFSS